MCEVGALCRRSRQSEPFVPATPQQLPRHQRRGTATASSPIEIDGGPAEASNLAEEIFSTPSRSLNTRYSPCTALSVMRTNQQP